MIGIAIGVIVGAVVITPGGPDFALLRPTWLAVGLFLALPFVYGLVPLMLVARCWLRSPRRP